MNAPDNSNPIEVRPSPLQGAAGLLASAATFVLWWKTGHMSDLLGGLGFLAIEPAWYVAPVQFSAGLKEAFSVRHRKVPKWAPVSAGVGALLIIASVVARVWHDL